MRQPQLSQLTVNEFQRSSLNKNFGRYLPEMLKNVNKLINFWIVNLSRTSLVFKIFNSINIVFVLTIIALSAFGLRTWIYPKYSNEVDGVNLAGTKRELAPLIIARKNHSPESIDDVVSNNLFRKERDEYLPPQTHQHAKNELEEPQKKPLLPSPELSLRGVMLLNDTKIAILEGSYSVLKGDKTEKKTIKRKGYYLGERIGDYKIEQIEKRAITLNNPSGQMLVVKLIRRVPNMDKPKKMKAPRIISTRPTVKNKPQLRSHISGRLTTPLSARKHISGR